MTTDNVTYGRGAELPPLQIQFLDTNSGNVDLTSYTCEVTLARSPSAPTVLTRSANGGPTGLVVNWHAGDLNLDGGLWYGTARATSGSGLDHVRHFTLTIV